MLDFPLIFTILITLMNKIITINQKSIRITLLRAIMEQIDYVTSPLPVLLSYVLDGKTGLWALLCPTGHSTQQANPLSSKYRSLVCQQLHPSCNEASRYPF